MKKYCLFSMLFFASFIVFATPLPANAIFQVATKQIAPNTLTLKWQIKKGYFLYKKSISLTKHSDSNVDLSAPTFPKGLSKTNKLGATYIVYRNKLTLFIPVLGKEPGESLIDVHYQGCSDDGFCYPPQQTQIKLTITKDLALSEASIEKSTAPTTVIHKKGQPNTQLEQLFSTNNWALIVVSFFGFGLLLAFTPCVLPMIPVLSGIIVGHGAQLSTRKAFLLSLSYVLSMSVTYSVIGAVIAFMGNNLQIVMQSPWAIGLFSALFIALALSMFNVYEVRLPTSWQEKLAVITRSQAGGHYVSAAIMGSLSILILSPCVTAPLIGVLGYIAQQGNITLGILSLFFLGLGMGTPLLLIGTSAGKLLPKTGKWMNEVKAFFGLLLLAVAIYLLERLLPSVLIMVLWASLLIFSAIYLGALRKAVSTLDKFNQGMGLMLLVYGILILIGASQGNNNPLQPLKSRIETPQKMAFTAKTIAEVQTILNQATQEGKPVIVDFYADWCASCKIIATTTLIDPAVTALLNNFVTLTVDVTAQNSETHALLAHFNVVAPPTFLFFNAKGQQLHALRLVGDVSAKTFLEKLRLALGD